LAGNGGDGNIVDIDLVLLYQMKEEIERTLEGLGPDSIDGLGEVGKKGYVCGRDDCQSVAPN